MAVVIHDYAKCNFSSSGIPMYFTPAFMMTSTCFKPCCLFAVRPKNVYKDAYYYRDVIMSAMAYQITSISIVRSAVCSGAVQRKHKSSASLAFVRGIHRWPVDSPHRRPVTRKMFPFHDATMTALKNVTKQRISAMFEWVGVAFDRIKFNHNLNDVIVSISHGTNIFIKLKYIARLWRQRMTK